MSTNRTDIDDDKHGPPSISVRVQDELREVMGVISQGRSLGEVVASALASTKRMTRANDVRFTVHLDELAAEMARREQGEGVVEDSPIATSRDDIQDTTARGEICDGCLFSRPDQWESAVGDIRWEEGDLFLFPVSDSSGKRVASLEVLSTTDGLLLSRGEVDGIRLLAELVTVALSKANELSRFEQMSDVMKQRTDLLEDLLTISSSIVSERSPETLSKMALTSLSTLFGFQRVSLIVFDETAGGFRWKAAFGYPHEDAEEAMSRIIPSDVVLEDFTSGNSISRSAYSVPFEKMSAKSKRYFITPLTTKRIADLGQRKEGEMREGDTLAFVLRDSAARIVGAVYASMPRDGRIPDKLTLETIEIFTSLAEVAMEDARLSAEREAALRSSSQRTEQLSRIFDLTSELMYVKDLDHLLDDVLKTLAQLLGLRRMVIGIRNDERGTFVVKSVYGYPKENVEGIKAVEYPTERVTHIIDPEASRFPESPVKWRKKMGRRTYYIPLEGTERLPEDDVYYPDSDLIRHPRKGKEHWHELDYMDTYIFDREGVPLAYIEILRPRDDRVPNAETIEVIEIFASLVGIAIENSRLFQSQVESRNSAEFFTDLLSHDIKNFNQAIMGYLDILRMYLTTPEQSAQIDKIALQVMNVNRLANDVRTMSRLTWGSMNLTRVDLGAVLLEALQNVKVYYLDREIEITSEGVEPQRYFINADELARELFSNILTNAVKYDPHMTARIEVDIERSAEGKNRWITVSIADYGSGVPDELKETVFERFSKGQKLRGSTGLGLHIVRMLSRRYKGAVWIEDRVEGDHTQGSVFRVRLPEY